MLKCRLRGGLPIFLLAVATPAFAGDIGTRVSAECGTCHQMTGPSDPSLSARMKRKGPPLFYAGNKFRREWLETWLQNPTRLRRAGDFAPAHVKETPDGETPDAASLGKHPTVGAASAREVAGYLMTLRPHDPLIAKEAYTPGRVSARMGAMDFVKFKGCGACHKDTPKYGGISGPELYTAWQRLQPAFITSYVRDPTAWEPRSLMPNKHLNDGAIHKLANYLRVIGEETGATK